jgi:methyl-accepting chemotaxis protein
MFTSIKNVGLKQKMLFPNVLYVVLLGAIIYFFVNSGSLIGALSEGKKKSALAVDSIQKTSLCIQEYLSKRIPAAELDKRYQTLLPDLKAQNLSADFEKLWAKVDDIRRLRKENDGISKQINELADTAVEQSNSYIRQVVPKLADESTKDSVTKLETLVILGANINTSSNYQLKVLFGRMQADIKEKDALMALFSTDLENVEKDIQDLTGTPFEALPKNSKECILKMKELATGYAKNVEAEDSIGKAIFGSIDARLKEIESVATRENEELFARLKDYFQHMLVIILGISLVGVLTSVFTVRSVTRALKGVIEGLSGGASEVNSASGRLSAASQSLAEGASEQAAAIEETSSSLEEMSSMTKQNDDNATQANGLMHETTRVVSAANESMEHLTTSMSEISKASEETSKIIKTIDEIAFQTNLLALNAAVEAARAGEAGAGFAVVADEVRNLAMRAADAAKNTAGLIEGTVKKVKEGSELVHKTSSEFSQVAVSSKKMGELVGEITAASSEQAQGIEQINRAVMEMDKVVQQNAGDAEKAASASADMSMQAEQLKGFVDDLVSIVSGSRLRGEAKGETGKGARMHRPDLRESTDDKTFGEIANAGGGKQKALSKARPNKRYSQAENLIPFDDDEIGTF